MLIVEIICDLSIWSVKGSSIALSRLKPLSSVLNVVLSTMAKSPCISLSLLKKVALILFALYSLPPKDNSKAPTILSSSKLCTAVPVSSINNLYLPLENIKEPLQDVSSFSILSKALLLVFNMPLQVYFF